MDDLLAQAKELAKEAIEEKFGEIDHFVKSWDIALPQQKSDPVLFENHTLCRLVLLIQPAHSCTVVPRQKDW